MRALLVSLLLVFSCASKHPPGPNHRFDDAEAWAAQFEDPSRDAWQKPEFVIETLALPPTAQVADLGAGTGYFAARLAKALPEGRVYAVDIESAMVDYLSKRAEKEGLSNLVPILALPDAAQLPGKVDLVLVVNTFHHLERRTEYFRRLADSLLPGARVAIIDFTLASPMGPPPAHRLSPETVQRELEAAGYRLQSKHDLPHQYFLIFEVVAAS